jgi:hypothetical protein
LFPRGFAGCPLGQNRSAEHLVEVHDVWIPFGDGCQIFAGAGAAALLPHQVELDLEQHFQCPAAGLVVIEASRQPRADGVRSEVAEEISLPLEAVELYE